MGYFDDFAAIIRKELGQAALGACAHFCSMIGFQLKEGQSHVGHAIVFSASWATSPARRTDGNYLIRLRGGSERSGPLFYPLI